MKKNKILRLASVMLMLCLITTCAISGTFAKYTTDGTATDTARVAKWGVKITAATTQDMFTKTYQKSDTDTTVTVSADTDVVAPGTKGQFTEFTIEGTPEVAVNVKYEATLTLKGWTVNSADYCPIEFKVGEDTFKIGDPGISSVSDLKTEVEKAIADFSKDYAVGTDLENADAPEISWEWAYTGNNDASDTVLGNLAADADTENDPTITLAVKVTVTQND